MACFCPCEDRFSPVLEISVLTPPLGTMSQYRTLGPVQGTTLLQLLYKYCIFIRIIKFKAQHVILDDWVNVESLNAHTDVPSSYQDTTIVYKVFFQTAVNTYIWDN